MTIICVTESTCSRWTGSSLVEKIPVKDIDVRSNITKSVGFPMGLATLPTPPNVYFTIICKGFSVLQKI